MCILEAAGVISRRRPLSVKHYWFDQRPAERFIIPDVAKLYSISKPIAGKYNSESWTLLTDLTLSDEDLMCLLHKDTRKQVRRAEREDIIVERPDLRLYEVLDEFAVFYNKFSNSKAEVRDTLKVSVQLHMLKRYAEAGMLEVARVLGRDKEPIVYHVVLVVHGRARVHHSASLFRQYESSEYRHYLGWANRYLHWKNMIYYKTRGCDLYDMGGWYTGKDNESLLRTNQFKKEFGGKVVCDYDSVYGCTTLGKLAIKIKAFYNRIFNSNPSNF
jgi:lipid II:glycine glycyltransferase (peptidoglycan interpeptide bridge formation enzyme)